jgi:hypothetical protein
VRFGVFCYGVERLPTLEGFFAVVVAQDTGELLVVDLNFFPGYSGMDDFPDRFSALLATKTS